ncbi:S-adenosylmethionine carrier 1, chloroplastic/mitochondrial-like [Gossypium australe]|uniref:S-adenosylmethionine carrier 1, chloroplastic/mitochondrial-like n=1 Tax=Gossypium australe TaxID=47621 RepID=A0A5B6U8V2_9ROSI|nr:S-adenosylmethionine carrier 1, chloroplastic/mitochondrial-like [Gossypium australe]
MDPQTLSSSVSTSHTISPDGLNYKKCNLLKEENRLLDSVLLKEENPFDFFQSIIAGAMAGVVVEAALYPIDTVKTRLQAARGGGKVVLKGLYSGLGGNLAGVLPASAIFLGVYEPAKQKLLKALPENLSAFAHLFIQTAGALGGAASSLVRVPTEVVKQRMQTGQFASAPAAVRLIVAKEGFRGLYAGYGSFLLRDLPFDAIQFCIYEQLRIGYKLAAQRDLNDPENAIIGAVAGAITGTVTNPLDVIKTRLMVQGSSKQYKGILDCVRTIMREEGTHAFLKGIGPRVLWIGIGGSIFFGVLEKTKQMLAKKRPEKHKSFYLKQE